MLALLKLLLGLFKGSTPPEVPAAPTKPIKKDPVWLQRAWGELGWHEIGRNQGIEKYIADARCGHPGDPWCAIFVNAMLERSGLRGTESALARSFERNKNRFRRLDGPAYGCIVTMWRGTRDSGNGHVFFYIGENDNGIVALGGNQNDSVSLQLEPRDRVTGYWWPVGAPDPVIGKVLYDKALARGREE
jgi:uncharacterized protein (TIGR02594 family)